MRWAKADIRMIQLLEPFEGGAYFGRQARASLMDALQTGAPSIPTVQALLLLSAQECGQGNLSQAWLYSGMAFRLLVDLGIVFDEVFMFQNFWFESLQERLSYFYNGRTKL
jgi:hypothetical protein